MARVCKFICLLEGGVSKEKTDEDRAILSLPLFDLIHATYLEMSPDKLR